ncbi:hypothetical protein [Sulfuricurvum sp.]|uniref:hypothetical protein n=1 Tax=Sulfuricurvum sp. TaxID=2025608 RepID=UPI0025E2D181|nr:hypothetical protein [Sulfuricurvum sp.]
MIVTSATQTGYTPATNKTTATKATSAYESVTPTTTQQMDQKAEIQKKEEPTKATAEVQNETQEPIITTQQEIEIKQQAAQTTSETEESPLAKAIQESSQTQSVEETKATGKIAEMEEKYKDVYTPVPETYSKADEELQTRKIYEAYPDYIDFREFLKIVDSYYDELGGVKMELGKTPTQDQIDKQKIAFDKAYELFGGEEKFTAMQKGAMEIMKKYPVNTLGKDERVHNATELARFTNAAVYEGLEQGKTIEEARIYAANLTSSCMDTSYTTINFLETLIKAGRADPDALKWFLDKDERYYPKNPNDIDFNATNNQTMDLRKYGIEGSWEYYEKPENQKGMIAEIEKKIGQFNFMLNNENLIKDAYSKLVADAQNLGNNAGYKNLINDDYMPRMVDGLNIFKNYKIYDN